MNKEVCLELTLSPGVEYREDLLETVQHRIEKCANQLELDFGVDTRTVPETGEDAAGLLGVHEVVANPPKGDA